MCYKIVVALKAAIKLNYFSLMIRRLPYFPSKVISNVCNIFEYLGKEEASYIFGRIQRLCLFYFYYFLLFFFFNISSTIYRSYYFCSGLFNLFSIKVNSNEVLYNIFWHNKNRIKANINYSISITIITEIKKKLNICVAFLFHIHYYHTEKE